jgi:hypothetical protein
VTLPIVDPFQEWDNNSLFNVHLMMALTCARTHTVLRKPNRTVLCNALQITRLELTNRGQIPPLGPYHIGQLKRDKHNHVYVGPTA